MKRLLLMGLLVLMYAPVRAMYTAPSELVLFLEKGDAAKMLNDLGSDGMLQQLKKWAAGSLQEFGDYYVPNDPHKITVLHKCTQANVTDEAILDFLLDDCGSNLESGTSSTTPLREAQRTPALKARFEATSARRNYERLATFVVRWDEGRIPIRVDDILAYFNLENPPDIDVCQVSHTRTVRDVLETSAKSDEAKVILAHAAPYQSNTLAALKSLIIGCCEGHAPSKLLTQFLACHKQVPCGASHFDLLFPQGLGEYLRERLAEPASETRTEEVCRTLKSYSEALPRDMKRHSYFWTRYDDKDFDRDSFAALVLQCGQDEARMEEYTQFVQSLQGRSYATLQQIAPVFEPLKDALVYPLRDKVLRVFMSCAAHELFDAIRVAPPADHAAALDLFTEHVIEHAIDIDSIDYEAGKTIGASLDESLAGILSDDERQTLQAALQCYRSNPPEAAQFIALLKGYYGKNGTSLDDITRHVDAHRLNIDLIPWSKSQAIGLWLDAKAHKPSCADVLALDSIKNYRTPANVLRRLIAKALGNEAAYAELEAYYKMHPQDVDNLLMVRGETIGTRILAGIVGPQKKEALAVARLVQKERKKTDAVFHSLYGKYEKDDTVFEDLKAWVAVFPVGDIDKLLYDATQPALGTFGDRVTARNNKDLSALFKAGRSKDPELVHKPKEQPRATELQSDGKSKSLMTRKNLMIAGMVSFGAYMISRSLKPKEQVNEYSIAA